MSLLMEMERGAGGASAPPLWQRLRRGLLQTQRATDERAFWLLLRRGLGGVCDQAPTTPLEEAVQALVTAIEAAHCAESGGAGGEAGE